MSTATNEARITSSKPAAVPSLRRLRRAGPSLGLLDISRIVPIQVGY